MLPNSEPLQATTKANQGIVGAKHAGWNRPPCDSLSYKYKQLMEGIQIRTKMSTHHSRLFLLILLSGLLGQMDISCNFLHRKQHNNHVDILCMFDWLNRAMNQGYIYLNEKQDSRFMSMVLNITTRAKLLTKRSKTLGLFWRILPSYKSVHDLRLTLLI